MRAATDATGIEHVAHVVNSKVEIEDIISLHEEWPLLLVKCFKGCQVQL